MPFNILVSTCLLEDTRYEENDVEVFINREKGERIIFFAIDNKPNKASGIRNFCYIKHESNRICDLLVYYNNDNLMYDILCLVELKPHKKYEGDAIDQLIKTQNRLSKRFEKSFRTPYGKPKSFKWIAYVCYDRRHASQKFDKVQRAKNKSILKQKFFDSEIKAENDLGIFIRKNAGRLVNPAKLANDTECQNTSLKVEG